MIDPDSSSNIYVNPPYPLKFSLFPLDPSAPPGVVVVNYDSYLKHNSSNFP
jgi:hypothetical protein